jgi:YQGE family putative transporter
MYDKLGVLIFMLCLVLGRPLQDIAYFTIQMLVIDTVSAIEKRNKYAYIFNQEFGFYIGRFGGCGLFLLLAYGVSNTFALRYSILIIGVIQLLSIVVAKTLLKGCADHAPTPAESIAVGHSSQPGIG